MSSIAYKSKARATHPDKNPGNDDASDMFSKIPMHMSPYAGRLNIVTQHHAPLRSGRAVCGRDHRSQCSA